MPPGSGLAMRALILWRSFSSPVLRPKQSSNIVSRWGKLTRWTTCWYMAQLFSACWYLSLLLYRFGRNK